jgi:UDP-N-acetylmuramyl pentapeptide phosphotransferase/UDP-N-acetylglucosamine-1-phosphate transferase
MSLLTSGIISGFLVLVASGWLVWHVRQWEKVDRESISPEEYGYRHRQVRRRMQTSTMLGIIAVAIFFGKLLEQWITSSLFFLVYWLAVLLLLLWMVVLAMVDIWATKFYYDRLRTTYFHEKLKLEAELHRKQAVRSNGKPPKSDGESG